MPNTHGEPGSPPAAPERTTVSFGSHIAGEIASLGQSAESHTLSIRRELEALNLSQAESNHARQNIFNRVATALEVAPRQIGVTDLNTSDDGINITINIPNVALRGAINQILSPLTAMAERSPHMASDHPSTSYPIYHQPFIPYQSGPIILPSYQNYPSQAYVPADSSTPQGQRVTNPPDAQQPLPGTGQGAFPQTPMPQQMYDSGYRPHQDSGYRPQYQAIPQPQCPTWSDVTVQQSPSASAQATFTHIPTLQHMHNSGPQQQTIPQPQAYPNQPFMSHRDERVRIRFAPPSDNHAPGHTDNGPMGRPGFEHLFGQLAGSLMGSVFSNLTGAAGESQGARSGPTGIERLLHMVPTTQDAFTEMKNLMVIRGENPLQCFDQEHLIEQWTSRKSDVETILNAIAKKQDHLQGVDFKELSKKAPEEQGLFFLKSLLKHVDSDPNIQMLAYLKQHNFLKRVEPYTPTSDSARTPETSNSPRSSSPTIITGTDSATETLEQTSAASGNQSDIEQAGKPGSRPEMEDVLDEEES